MMVWWASIADLDLSNCSPVFSQIGYISRELLQIKLWFIQVWRKLNLPLLPIREVALVMQLVPCTLWTTHTPQKWSQEDLKKQRATQIAPFRWVEKGWHKKTGKMGFSFFWPRITYKRLRPRITLVHFRPFEPTPTPVLECGASFLPPVAAILTFSFLLGCEPVSRNWTIEPHGMYTTTLEPNKLGSPALPQHCGAKCQQFPFPASNPKLFDWPCILLHLLIGSCANNTHPSHACQNLKPRIFCNPQSSINNENSSRNWLDFWTIFAEVHQSGKSKGKKNLQILVGTCCKLHTKLITHLKVPI